MISKDALVENMDLVGGYLLILLMLFAANISLLFGNCKIDNSRLILISSGFFIISAVLMFLSNNFLSDFSYVMVYYNILFLVLSIAIFLIIIYYSRDSGGNLKNSIIIMGVLSMISISALSFSARLSVFEILAYSLLGFIVLFLVYYISKLLVHAKRDYPVIVREFMCLSAILLFIFALTFNSTMALNYKMFNAFLILTPTYQLIYVVIAVAVGVIIGFVCNDIKGGNS